MLSAVSFPFHANAMHSTLPVAIAHLVATRSPRRGRTDILDEWRWLVGTGKRVRLVTACGDVFLEDALEEKVAFLDVGAPALLPIAETRQAFDALLSDPSFIDTYLYPERVALLRSRGLALKKDQVYSLRTPLSLGGEATAENTEITDLDVHFSFAGQVERQLADLPPGAPVSGLRIQGLPSTKPWWRFW